MKNNKLNFKKALDQILKSQAILLTMHEGPDGDDLGSVLAMDKFLQSIGKEVFICIQGPVPQNLSFLPGSEKVTDIFPSNNLDLVIVFGCNKIERTAIDQLKNTSVPIIDFDHHPDNINFGMINVVDPDTSAVAELVYYFLQFADANITKEIATCLLTGIFTDTGGFKHANTSAEALQVAAELLKKGARIDRIAFQTMGRKRPTTIKAWAKGLDNARFDPEKKMVFSVLTEEDLKDIGATDEDLDGFVELLNNLPQSKFALVLRQDGNAVKGSLRSEPHKNVDVSKIARSFGGGGHKLASGFRIEGKIKKQGEVWQID